MKIPNLGPVQLKIMQYLWSKNRANAKEITETLNISDPIAHSTVQTLLRQLEEKKIVSHESEDRTFVFFPLIQEADYKRRAAREFLGNMFAGSPSELFAHLLESEKIDPGELEKIRELIRRKKETRDTPEA